MMIAPVIRTERLTLRMPQAGDWQAFRAFRLSGRAAPVFAAETEGLSWTLFAAFFGHWQLRGFGRFIIEDRATAETIGHVGPYFPQGWPEPELTWSLWTDSAEGQGIAYEAALAARDYVYRNLGWKTAVSFIDSANTRSIALATRLGAWFERSDPGVVKPFNFYRHPTPGAKP
jgi:RimJ/RimL family protein N-acetyltransferase